MKAFQEIYAVLGLFVLFFIPCASSQKLSENSIRLTIGKSCSLYRIFLCGKVQNLKSDINLLVHVYPFAP